MPERVPSSFHSFMKTESETIAGSGLIDRKKGERSPSVVRIIPTYWDFSAKTVVCQVFCLDPLLPLSFPMVV